MSPPDRDGFSAMVEATWSRLHWHLDATAHQPSVVFVSCEDQRDEDTLRRRTEQLARLVDWQFTEIDPQRFLDWARLNLPFDGIVWLSLRDATDDTALRSLHLLNHLRSGLVREGGGCIVITGGTGLSRLAVQEAADLWSVRSFADHVSVEPRTDLTVMRPAEAEPPRRDRSWSMPTLTLPPRFRTETTARLVAALDQVYLSLPDDTERAATWLQTARERTTPENLTEAALVALAATYLAGARHDTEAATQAVNQALDDASALPADPFRLDLTKALVTAAEDCDLSVDLILDASAATVRAATDLHDLSDAPESEQALAEALESHGYRLSTTGHLTECLESTHRAVQIYERLAAANPAAYEPDLATALNNYAASLSEVGRRDDALEPARRALDLRERLARANPAAYEPDLARSLNNYGIRLSEVGRHEEALEPSHRAVQIRERLAAANPAAHEPDLAGSLSSYGIRLSEVGRHEEALEPSHRAVQIYERLAAANPAAHEPDLATALSNYSIRLEQNGRADDALKAATRSVEIYERVAASNAPVHGQHLADARGRYVALLNELGRGQAEVAQHRYGAGPGPADTADL